MSVLRPMPAAEVDVNADLVRDLLAAQCPELARLPLTVMANGWDNVMFRLGEDLAVRMPRREAAARLVEHEQQWLPLLALRLPLPVPAPVFAGRPAPGYPWSWSVVPFLPGRPAATLPPADPERAAADLGAFLGALHAPAPPDAPANPVRGIPLAGRDKSMTANLDIAGDRVDRDAVRRQWRDALAVPAWEGPPLWLHGDLHPLNILVHDGAISGVIDFGDITAGDPAGDLAATWMLAGPRSHRTFGQAYETASGRAISGDTWARARGWALAFGVVFVAHSADNPLMAEIGHGTLAALREG